MEIDCLQVLRTDASGMPLEWIGYQEAAKLYHLGQVAYACGSRLFVLRGGYNAKTGQRSQLEINSILATHSHDGIHKIHENYRPPLSNPALFRRDDHQQGHAGGLRDTQGTDDKPHPGPCPAGRRVPATDRGGGS